MARHKLGALEYSRIKRIGAIWKSVLNREKENYNLDVNNQNK